MSLHRSTHQGHEPTSVRACFAVRDGHQSSSPRRLEAGKQGSGKKQDQAPSHNVTVQSLCKCVRLNSHAPSTKKTGYALDDRVKVTNFLHRTPCLSFLGRLGGTDMVGEKLNSQAVAALFQPLAGNHGIRCVTLFAVEGDSPYYCLLAEGESESSVELQKDLEAALCSFHHYRLARELHQLYPAEVLIVRDSSIVLTKRANLCGLTSGEMKVQPLEAWKVEGLPRHLG